MKRFLCALGAVLGVMWWGAAVAGDGVPGSISYQGKLTDTAGQPVPDNTYQVQFKLYTDETGGTAFWASSTGNVQTSGGLFTTAISPIAAADLLGKTDVWLETWVALPPAALAALSPRVKLASVPFALVAPWSGVVGAPSSLPPSGAAGGDLTGTYPEPSIKDGAVTPSKLASGALSSYTGNIQNLASTSANPAAVGSVSTGAGSQPYAVAVSGRYAYVPNYGTGTLQVIDVSNPAGPTVVGSVATGSGAVAVAASGRYAYVANYGANTLQVIDVSNPVGPSVVGSVATGSSPRSVAVSGRYAYVASYGGRALEVIDVSNPAAPSVVGSVATGGHPCSVAVAGRYAYLANNPANTLQVIDVSNPVTPSLVGSVATDSLPRSVAVSGRYAYVVNEAANNLQVIDVSNPAGPSFVGSVGTSMQPMCVAVSGRYAYVANRTSSVLQMIDVSNPAAPAVVGSVGTGASPVFVALSGRHACVANSGSDTLEVIDVMGIETTALNAHSLEAGTLQVRGSAVVANQLSVGGGLNVGPGGIFSDGDAAFDGTVKMTGFQLGSSATAGQVLTADSTGAGTWQTAPAGVGGAGTDDYLARWNGSGDLEASSVYQTDAGDVGIGTTSPGAKLEVAGLLKVTGGSPGDGKVLTSDASGLASWQTPASGMPSGSSGQTLRHDGAAWVANDTIYNDGSTVGIGTTTTTAKLDVRSSTTSGTAIYAEGGPSGGKAAIFKGNVQVKSETTGLVVAEIGEGLDYAEGFDVANADRAEPGTVLVIDPDNAGKLAVSSHAYDRKVAGVVAGANGLGSGVRLGTGKFDHDVALAGRVYCNVDATYGAVEPGDLLTTSPTPGFAMVVGDHLKAQGAILGKAMQRLAKGGKGRILVLVTLQ